MSVIIGKTVTRVENTEGQFYIGFTDGTWFKVESPYADIELSPLSISDHTSYILVKLGIITKEEYDEAIEKKRLAVRAAVKRVGEERLKRLAVEELELYERLKLKYK